MLFVIGVWTFLRALLLGSAAIALENLALRHQLLVLQRSGRRPRLARWDRVLWVWLCRVWAGWRSSLVIVQPATVLAWHRQGFQLYWQWKSRPNSVGRPKLDAEIRHPIHRMAHADASGRNSPLLGYEVAGLTVAKYMHRPSPRPSPTWRAFLTAHARELVAIDFFVVPTLTFRLLFAFVVLRHHRRELVHFNVTDHPTAAWTVRQLVEAFPDDTAPPYLLRDRDGVYGEEFVRHVQSMGIREVLTAPRAPRQNPFVFGPPTWLAGPVDHARVSGSRSPAWRRRRRGSRACCPRSCMWRRSGGRPGTSSPDPSRRAGSSTAWGHWRGRRP